MPRWRQPATGPDSARYLRGAPRVSPIANGRVTFTAILPGWYADRMTDIRVEVFLQNDTGMTAQATTPVAFPQAVTQAVNRS